MKKILIFLLLFLMISDVSICDEPFVLPGIIKIQKRDNELLILKDTNKTYFSLPYDSYRKFSGLNWLNNSNSLIGPDFSYKRQKITQCNLVKVNLDNLNIDTLHTLNDLRYGGNVYPSRSDSLIFFSVNYPESRPVDYEADMAIDFIIIDQNKSIVKEFKKICSYRGLNINESPWSLDENNIVYSYRYPYEDNSHKKESGVYILNINTGDEIRIAKKGKLAAWSPIEDKIAYVSDNNIMIYDIKSKTTRLLFKKVRYEWIIDLRWSPEGKFIFFSSFKNYLNIKLLHSYHERLIDVGSGKEIEFRKINKGNTHFSWKE